MGPGIVKAQHITIVGFRPVARVESHDREGLLVPVLGIWPVNLHIGITQGIDIGFDIRSPSLGFAPAAEIVGKELP